jgi:hypothetical protein
VAGAGRGRECLQSRLDRDQDGGAGGSLAEGVDTPLWLLTAPELAGTTSRYFYRRHKEKPNPQVEDADARGQLWDLARRSLSI